MIFEDPDTLIKKVRESRDWTQAELAEAMDLSVKTIGRWERGTREPRVSEYQKLTRLAKKT